MHGSLILNTLCMNYRPFTGPGLQPGEQRKEARLV
jgi:hypothetical protein